MNKHERLREALTLSPVIPVLTIRDAESAVPLAIALRDGGLPVLEITLRTSAAYDAMRRIKGEVPGVVVGAGTVLAPEQISGAISCGAAFLVSPGSTPKLLEAAIDAPVPMLPAAATASEAMALMEHGFRAMKFFPAEPAGGVPYLKALSAPLPDAVFCPTGGLTEANAGQYLALSNVICVGGAWVAPQDMVDAGNWAGITAIARRAAGLRPARQAAA